MITTWNATSATASVLPFAPTTTSARLAASPVATCHVAAGDRAAAVDRPLDRTGPPM
jgi:hypothetical protein